MGIREQHSIAYYISAHGYGHGVRSCSILRAIHTLYPQLTVHVVSRLPEPFLRNRIGAARNIFRSESFDTGMVQIDSIRVDVDATLSAVEQLHSRREERIAAEASFLRENTIGLIVADIPSIPIEAAARRGIPRIAVSNFAWDWIYSAFVPRNQRWHAVVETFRRAYGQTDLLLRLPFCDSMSAFPRIEDIPLVAAPGKARRKDIMAMTGCDPAKKWVLLSFTTLDWDESALKAVERMDDYEFFTVRPLAWERRNIHALDREQVDFSSVIASVDAVVSKPGFGILSDCIVNRKPLIYADRCDFLEYAILEAAIKKYIKHLHIPSADLYLGDLRDSLDRIWERPDPPENLPAGGDEIAAGRIVSFL